MIAGTLVIGLGNPSRRDDGVGWVVAEAVGRRLGDRLHVRLGDGEPARLLDAWGGARLAVVIDAMRSGAEPGSIRVFEPAEGSAPAPVPAHDWYLSDQGRRRKTTCRRTRVRGMPLPSRRTGAVQVLFDMR